MRTLAFNQGHDICAVCIDDGKLIFSKEKEGFSLENSEISTFIKP